MTRLIWGHADQEAAPGCCGVRFAPVPTEGSRHYTLAGVSSTSFVHALSERRALGASAVANAKYLKISTA